MSPLEFFLAILGLLVLAGAPLLGRRERNAEIIHRRNAGEWPRAIARSMGLTHNVVIGVCNRAGLSSALGYQECIRGEAVGGAKLTPDAVREIRSAYRPYDRKCSQYVLADRFGVSQAQVSEIVHRRSWAHIK